MKETKPKPRASKLPVRESAKPLAQPEDRPLRDDHPAAEIFRLAKEAATTEQASITSNTIASPAIAPDATIEPFQPEPWHGAIVESPAIAQPAIAPDAFCRIPNGILDRVLPTLNPYDQLILLRLYRLSKGFGKDECTVGYQTLAVACNMSARQAQISVERLILASWISRVGVEQGGQSRQGRGSVYRVNLPAAGAKERGAIAQGTIAGSADNKDKDLKEKIKRGARAQDFSRCPDCEGRGFWWPEGFEKGVAKCKHKRLA
jgi:hypothetical protein